MAELVAGAPTTTELPSELDVVIATTCQAWLEDGRWRVVVAVGDVRQFTSALAFTVLSPSEEDWDGSPVTAATYQRPWEDVADLPSPMVPISLAERPIDP